MRIAVMGAGGVGGTFGARLARGGAEVIFVARGVQLAALRERGLTIESAAEPLTLPHVETTDDPASVGPVDAVLFTVKLWDTETAARALLPILRPQTAIISLQNGVQKDDVLRAILGPQHVMGGVAYIGASIVRPGVIAQIGTIARLVFGEYDDRPSPRAQALLEACRRGGIDAEIAPDIRRAIWEKFVFLVGLSGATSTMRSTLGPILANPLSRSFLLDIMREAVALGRAQGVALPPNYAEERLAFADTLPPQMLSSMYHDLQRGRPLELEWLSGAVATLGTAAGLATPANSAVRAILGLHANGRPDAAGAPPA